MRFARCITKATYTHSQYVIPIYFPLQQWLHERVSILRYTYIACLLCLSLGALDEIGKPGKWILHEDIALSNTERCSWRF